MGDELKLLRRVTGDARSGDFHDRPRRRDSECCLCERLQPDTGTVDYGAAKAALVNLTKALSQELGPHGIRINDVSPGPVSTDLWLGREGVAQTVAKATGVDPETAKKNVLASIGGLATGRMTTPEEVATLVVMLASPRTANVTGSNYVIDGGLIKTL